jgi:two-component system nitrogen regulation response regulator NtrX
MRQARILIADDEQATCKYIDQHIKIEPSIPAQVEFAHDRDAAIALLQTSAYDLILVDLWMPDAQGILDREAGIKILKQCNKQRSKQLNKQQRATQAIMITANSSAETALEASGLGVYDYIRKPIDYTSLIEKIKLVLSQHSQDSDDALPSTVASIGEDDQYTIIGNSNAMIEVMKEVGRTALSDADVLVYGESGTGKELVARAIHKLSHRRNAPFIPYNCSAVPSELIEAELFGIGKRVATAVDQRPGRFLQAHSGTIFLDEIGHLNLDMQPKLLRVLDYKEIQGVGVDVQRVDVRIIAATNRDLRKAVEAHEFRADLYYRLKFMITLPPLRERLEDISLLAEHFRQKYARTLEQKRIRGFDKNVLEAFEQYHWPGNVRELEKAIERAVIICPNVLIRQSDLPPEIFDKSPPTKQPPADTDSFGTELKSLLDIEMIRTASQRFERIFLENKLEQNGWNIQKTAKQIGIRRQSLHRKLNELGLHRSLDED